MLSKKICIVSIPEWRGAGRHGTERAPEAFEKFGLREKLEARGVEIVGSYQVNPIRFPHKNKETANIKYEAEIVDTVRSSFSLLRHFTGGGNVLVVLGGDHTVSIASVAAQVGCAGNDVGVVWIDAHGDVHTPETTPSGNVHGMPLAVLLGYGSTEFTNTFGRGVLPRNVVHIGANNLEPEEVEFFTKHKIPFFPQEELNTDIGFARMLQALVDLGKKAKSIIVSVDMDAFEETLAPGVHARNKNGIRKEKALAIFDCIKSHCRVVGVDIAEIVPHKDRGHKTVELAYDFLVQLLVP